jgi:hypothetical protein
VTHVKDRHGRGRLVHLDDSIRIHRRFLLSALMMVAIGLFPPAVLVAVPVWVCWIRDEHRRKAAEQPTDAQRVIARGRRNV